MNLTLKRQHVLSEIVAVLEDDGVVLVELVGQLVGVLPHEPQRLLGTVHHPALLDLELPQHQSVLQGGVEVLQGLHVVVGPDLITQIFQPALLRVVVGLDLVRQLD